MNNGPAPVALSPLDEERFGIKVAKAGEVTVGNLESILDFCRENRVSLLIARCQADDLAAAQALERSGALIMDTLVYWSRRMDRGPLPEDTGEIPIRFARPGEEEEIRKVARAAFKGYFGHYHADPRLDRAKADEVYVDWGYRSCVDPEVAERVLVAEVDGSIEGFVTLRRNSPEEGEIVVGGVTPALQGRGVYRSFIVQGMKWFLSQGARTTLVSTQLPNLAVRKVWARLGFEPGPASYTFHKWFD